MYRSFLLLMIALLPLRGWIGDAMAAGMIAHQVQADQRAAIVSQAQPLHLAGHEDCIGHGSDLRADPASGDDSSGCPACVMCQACSAVALASFTEAGGALAIGQQLPTGIEPRFASADEARGFKPPIS